MPFHLERMIRSSTRADMACPRGPLAQSIGSGMLRLRFFRIDGHPVNVELIRLFSLAFSFVDFMIEGWIQLIQP